MAQNIIEISEYHKYWILIQIINISVGKISETDQIVELVREFVEMLEDVPHSITLVHGLPAQQTLEDRVTTNLVAVNLHNVLQT